MATIVFARDPGMMINGFPITWARYYSRFPPAAVLLVIHHCHYHYQKNIEFWANARLDLCLLVCCGVQFASAVQARAAPAAAARIVSSLLASPFPTCCGCWLAGWLSTHVRVVFHPLPPLVPPPPRPPSRKKRKKEKKRQQKNLQTR